ncbi:MAG TPA: ABC transporter permease [Rhodanobacteraceae bacterium]
MHVPPILAALRKHKSGVVLISLQIALTLAIVCNAIFIIANRIERVSRPTGIVENNLVLATQQWADAPTGSDQASIDKNASLRQRDLAVLRGLPGVASAAAVSTVPLGGNGWNGAVSRKPHISIADRSSYQMVGFYFMGPPGVSTLGVKLIAGRNFKPDEVTRLTQGRPAASPVIIISRHLAHRLFPHGHALGQTVYLNGKPKPITIIGVVERLQTMNVGFSNNFAFDSVIVPQITGIGYSVYAIRAKPGRMAAVMHEIRPALYKADPMRVMDDDSVQSFAQIRHDAYEGDIGMAILMGVICLILIAITAAGIVGLTSFWVGQRRKQIGIRRAIGATRGDILRHFQTENFLIVGAGIVLGLLLAFALNILLMRHYELPRLPLSYLPIGALALWVLGQAAVLGPALRAAAVPPVVATRSV